VDVALDSADPSKFVETPGNGALVNSGGRAADFRSKMEFGDIEFRFNVMLPKGGDSGLFFMDRYELQLIDDPGGCFAVLGGKGPRAQTYRGPGEWHTVTGRFFAPRFNNNGKKITNAKFEQITVDGVMVIGATEVGETTGGAHGGNEAATGPLRFQGAAGLVALGDVRVRLIADGEATAEGVPEKWLPLADAGDSVLDYELRGRFTLSDAGSAAIDLRVINEEPILSLLLDDTGTSEGRTGTIAGYAPIKTQFLQPGVPYQLKVRVVNLVESTNIMVWLNGVLVNQIDTNGPLPPGNVQLRPEIAPGTELVAEDLEVRFLRK